MPSIEPQEPDVQPMLLLELRDLIRFAACTLNAVRHHVHRLGPASTFFEGTKLQPSGLHPTS
eukprot:2885-Eustigmatos_ZCMA.PRE.1